MPHVTDPFADVLASLKSSLDGMAPIGAPLSDVSRLVGDIDTALDYAYDVPDVLSACEGVLELLSTLCQALIEVPFVDVVAEVASGIMDDVIAFLGDLQADIKGVMQNVVGPAKKVFDELSKSLGEAVTVVQTITTTIPNTLNTVQIMSYCLDVGQAVLPYLAGTSAATTTQAFVDAMTTIRDDVAKAMKPLAAFAADIAAVVSAVAQALGSVTQSISSTFDKIKSGLGTFESIVDPISNAFKAIENAIAPVKWAMDAVQSVMEHVIEPIIKAIMDATGISALLSLLTDEIEKALGVKPLFDLLDSTLKGQPTTQWQTQGGASSVGNGASAITALTTALKDYSSRDKSSTYKLVTSMVAAITNSPLGPGPFKLPDWPIPPQIGTTSTGGGVNAALGGQVAMLRIGSPEEVREQLGRTSRRIRRAARLRSGFVAMAGVAAAPGKRSAGALGPMAAVAAPAALWVTDALAMAKVIRSSYDDVGLPNVTRLIAAAAAAKQGLATAQTIGPTLAAQLVQFDAARHLPADFDEEMADLAALFSDSVDLVDFLLAFDFAPAMLKSLEVPLKAQAADATTASSKAGALAASGDAVDQAVAKVEAAFPGKAAFTAGLQYIDQVAAGAAALGNLQRRAVALDTKLGGTFTARVGALSASVDTDAAAALAQMATVQSLVADAMAQAAVISTYMTDYATRIASIGKDASVISSDALPGLASGVQVCNTIASLLDPLLGILADMNCVAGTNADVKSLGDVLDTFKSGLKSAIGGQDSAPGAAFAFVINNTAPTGRIASDIDAVNQLVSQRQAAFGAAITALAGDLAALKVAMAPTKSFTYQANVTYQNAPAPTLVNGKPVGGGTTVTKAVTQQVDNFFIDPAFRTTALQLIDDMNNAAIAAGIPN